LHDQPLQSSYQIRLVFAQPSPQRHAIATIAKTRPRITRMMMPTPPLGGQRLPRRRPEPPGAGCLTGRLLATNDAGSEDGADGLAVRLWPQSPVRPLGLPGPLHLRQRSAEPSGPRNPKSQEGTRDRHENDRGWANESQDVCDLKKESGEYPSAQSIYRNVHIGPVGRELRPTTNGAGRVQRGWLESFCAVQEPRRLRRVGRDRREKRAALNEPNRERDWMKIKNRAYWRYEMELDSAIHATPSAAVHLAPHLLSQFP
jgi:hypothetical protein